MAVALFGLVLFLPRSFCDRRLNRRPFMTAHQDTDNGPDLPFGIPIPQGGDKFFGASCALTMPR
jgi:hypothetical protein